MSHQLSASLPDMQPGQEPSFALLTHCYGNALQRLNRSFQSHRPLAILMGDGQSARRFVIRTFLSGLDENTVAVRIREPCVGATDLMRKIVRAVGFEPKDMSLGDLDNIFAMFLAFQQSHDRRTVVCIEQLEDSDWWVLDKIRQLVELEVQGQQGLMVLIAEQPEFKQLLSVRPLSTISPLAGYRISLAPFTLSETTECIRNHVESSGSASIGDVFQYQAITLIHELCGGVPDAISALVGEVLELAKREGLELVTTALVERVREASGASMAQETTDHDAQTVELSEVSVGARRLIVRLTGEDVREQSLRRGHTLIGRSRLCDIRIDSPAVSRHHALINYSNGGAMLVDLGSTNGTFVDGHAVSSHELVAGESIRVGHCIIEYIVDDELQSSLERAARSAGLTLNSKPS